MLRIRDLSAGYGHKNVLNGIDLDVPAGSVVAILGANGAGKSTLLKAIVGLIGRSSGTIELDGKPLTNESADRTLKSGVALVAEQRELFKSMSVADNLLLGGYLRRGQADMREDFERLLDVFPRLRERVRQPARTLSGGEQQMLAIARALMSRPSYLLLDEPSLGLAPRIVEEIFDIVRRISAEGTSIVVIEQNVNLALDVAQSGYVMETGSITLAGTAAELRSSDTVQAAYL
ncbi:ABC transporter ATP-binding protein [Hyphomicrobium sp. CS1BSMeth3]|uniref:ABC transporter ATP-binding protein n=1 Tax=Hyphomicrobium sp. CS1BSMeth3 TaxID=1892844 RepID=UPI000930E6DF|nr:ABC transporter ATP-binding protein [Hyphomicrobium sp. CS1BSMeth3]